MLFLLTVDLEFEICHLEKDHKKQTDTRTEKGSNQCDNQSKRIKECKEKIGPDDDGAP